MGIAETIQKILQNNQGHLSIEKLNEMTGHKYARETILEFVRNDTEFLSFDGHTVVLLKYQLQHLIKIIDDFVSATGISRKDGFYLSALSLFVQRQLPDLRLDESLFSNELVGKFDFIDSSVLDKIQLNQGFKDYFIHEMKNFFESGMIGQLDDEEFYYFTREFYDYFLNSLSESRGLYSTPNTLVNLICELITNKKPLVVYNPAGGILKLLTGINIKLKSGIHAIASELNRYSFKVGQLFAQTNGFHPDFKNVDSIEELNKLGNNTFDLIISIPPFNAKIGLLGTIDNSYNDVALDIISNSIYHLRDEGEALFLVPDRVLFGSSRNFLRFRKEIIESKLIHTIISLPLNLFLPGSSVKTSLLHFKKGSHASVQFIDASSTEFYSISGMRSVELKVDKIVNLVQHPINNNIVSEPKIY